eukprot:scaffold8235_cov113-Cylindrotheca_fusiformis.AAC.2
MSWSQHFPEGRPDGGGEGNKDLSALSFGLQGGCETVKEHKKRRVSIYIGRTRDKAVMSGIGVEFYI